MFLLQFTNILVLIAIIAIPAVAVFFIVRSIKEKNLDGSSLELRVAVLEKKVRELEEYVNESYD